MLTFDRRSQKPFTLLMHYVHKMTGNELKTGKRITHSLILAVVHTSASSDSVNIVGLLASFIWKKHTKKKRKKKKLFLAGM